MHTENDNIGIGTADLIANIVVYLQYRQINCGIGTTLVAKRARDQCTIFSMVQ